MKDLERRELMRRKAALKAELLDLTRNIRRVQEILIEINGIDGQLGA